MYTPQIIVGVHDILVNSIMKTDLDLRRILFSQIVLSGGTTLFPGFGDRLLTEVKSHPNSPKNTKIRISAPTERLSSVWIGKKMCFRIKFVSLHLLT